MASRISSAYTTAASADSVKQSQTDTPFAGIQTWHSGFHRVYTSQASDWARIRLALHSPVLGTYLQGIATVVRWVWVAGYQDRGPCGIVRVVSVVPGDEDGGLPSGWLLRSLALWQGGSLGLLRRFSAM